MKLGFIGTGQITKAVVTGIINSKLKISKIFVSERNKKISRILKFKSKKITIIKKNQDIINKSDWVFLAVTPTVGNKILSNLKFNKNKMIISFISTINLNQIILEPYHYHKLHYAKVLYQFIRQIVRLKSFLIN